jgi:hypothetical protein
MIINYFNTPVTVHSLKKYVTQGGRSPGWPSSGSTCVHDFANNNDEKRIALCPFVVFAACFAQSYMGKVGFGLGVLRLLSSQ